MSYLLIEQCADPNQTLDLLADGSQVWTLCDDAPPNICDQSKVYADTAIDTDCINDLSVPLPSEHEYWHNPATMRLIYQGVLDDCADSGVTAEDLSKVINPIVPRVQTPTTVDYEAKRPYFPHLPANFQAHNPKYVSAFLKSSPEAVQVTQSYCQLSQKK